MTDAVTQLRARGRVISALRRGGVVLYPTESVWGLGCDPGNRAAVDRLLGLKRRGRHKGLILVAADSRQFLRWQARLAPTELDRLQAPWPGPHTWIVPAHFHAAPWVTGNRRSIALRVSAHPAVQRLCREWGGALVSTSANLTGRLPPRRELPLRRYFGRRVDGVWPGALGGAPRPTSIQDFRSGRVVRA